jgi:hypothetical protein
MEVDSSRKQVLVYRPRSKRVAEEYYYYWPLAASGKDSAACIPISILFGIRITALDDCVEYTT